MILNLAGTSKNSFEIGETNATYSLKLAKSASMTSNLTLTLPTSNGLNGDVLQTNGSGVLSWKSGTCGVEAFGEIHLHDGATAQTIPSGTTYTKLTSFQHNGYGVNCTPNVANNKIIITSAGYYVVNGSFSFESNRSNIIIKASVFLNGVEQDQIHFGKKIASAGDVGCGSFTGVIQVPTVNADIDVRVRHDYGSTVDIIMLYSNFNVEFLNSI